MTTPITHTARPQEPIAPFPYIIEEVIYGTKIPGIKLAGSLTLPEGDGPFPAVVLISGMGPKDRDASMCGHKPFGVLADHLTKHGIAVLRFDKRGVGQSTGTYDMSLTSKDFAEDVLVGVNFLRKHKAIDAKKIGLIGSSEGGMIAPMVATESKDIAFIVLMAGVIETNTRLAVKQAAAQMRADGASEALLSRDFIIRSQVFDIIRLVDKPKLAKQQCMDAMATYLKTLPKEETTASEHVHFAFTESKAEMMVDMFNSPWYRFFFSHNPVEVLKKITVPVLALNGSLDHIVPCRRSLSLIAKTLIKAGNRRVTTIEMPKMNHQFQTCKTGAIKEYAEIEETIAPHVLEVIGQWIHEQTTEKQS